MLRGTGGLASTPVVTDSFGGFDGGAREMSGIKARLGSMLTAIRMLLRGTPSLQSRIRLLCFFSRIAFSLNRLDIGLTLRLLPCVRHLCASGRLSASLTPFCSAAHRY